MTYIESVIRVPGLTKLDAHILTRELGNAVRFEEVDLTTDKAGEPATLLAIMFLGAPAIKAIALWLMKNRSRECIEIIVEEQHPDGTLKRKTERVCREESASPPSSIIDRIGAVLKVDAGTIHAAKELVDV